MAIKQLVLNEAETKLIAELLAANLGDLSGPDSGEHAQRAWRLLVKVDELVGGPGFLGTWDLELPLWVRRILWRTFNPPQVKPKAKVKAKPKATAAAPRAAASGKVEKQVLVTRTPVAGVPVP